MSMNSAGVGGSRERPFLFLVSLISGRSRFNPRNRHVARVLQDLGFGTLLFDLLTRTATSA